VLPPDFEGLPLSLIEAMACGCVPVAAETDSGIPELLAADRNGLILSGRD
jgi:glycosyltransferase involved in cell wall biosynthesis